MSKTAQAKATKKKRVKTGRYHDTLSGQYIPKKQALKRPARSVAESRVVEDGQPAEQSPLDVTLLRTPDGED